MIIIVIVLSVCALAHSIGIVHIHDMPVCHAEKANISVRGRANRFVMNNCEIVEKQNSFPAITSWQAPDIWRHVLKSTSTKRLQD